MKTKGYVIVGKLIGLKYMNSIGRAKKIAFMAGCVLPEYNLITYIIRTVFKRQSIHGYEIANPRMLELIEELDSVERFGVREFFKLGMLIHYVVDAFSFSQNEEFLGTCKDRISYENEILTNLNLKTKENFLAEDSKYEFIKLSGFMNNNHYRYIRSEKNAANDTEWIGEGVSVVSKHYKERVCNQDDCKKTLAFQR